MLRTIPTESAALSDPAVLPLAQASAAQGITPVAPAENSDGSEDSLFEHFAWLYIFCREKLFRDDTKRMIAALWPNGKAAAGEKIIELGCGPGFYSCGLAERFREISVLGKQDLFLDRFRASLVRRRPIPYLKHRTLRWSTGHRRCEWPAAHAVGRAFSGGKFRSHCRP